MVRLNGWKNDKIAHLCHKKQLFLESPVDFASDNLLCVFVKHQLNGGAENIRDSPILILKLAELVTSSRFKKRHKT